MPVSFLVLIESVISSAVPRRLMWQVAGGWFKASAGCAIRMMTDFQLKVKGHVVLRPPRAGLIL
jgi:hypothetical protein